MVKKASPTRLMAKKDRGVNRRKHSLEELVAKITPANRHQSVDWGTLQGNEVW